MKDKLDEDAETPMPDHADKAEAGREATGDVTDGPPEDSATLERVPEQENVEPQEPDSDGDRPLQAAEDQSDLASPVPGVPDEAIEPGMAAGPVVRVEQMAPTEVVGEVPPQLHIRPDVDNGLPHSEGAAEPELARPDELAIKSFVPEPDSEPDEPLAAAALAPSGEPTEEKLEAYEPRTEVAAFEELTADAPPAETVPVETTAAEPAPDEPDWLAPSDARPVGAASLEETGTETRHSKPGTMDAPPTELAAEPPLRDRIPSVLPVELEAIKTPLAVPVFEPPPRRPEIQQPASSLLSRAPESAVAAAAAGVAVPVTRRRCRRHGHQNRI